MSEATEKQISFAKSLGIENPERYSKEALKEIISEKAGGDKSSEPQKTPQKRSMGQTALTEGISTVQHDFQSEYECGPAGNRHKIKYRTMHELTEKIGHLKAAGYLIQDDFPQVD